MILLCGVIFSEETKVTTWKIFSSTRTTFFWRVIKRRTFKFYNILYSLMILAMSSLFIDKLFFSWNPFCKKLPKNFNYFICLVLLEEFVWYLKFFGFTFFTKKVKKEFFIKSTFNGDRAINFKLTVLTLFTKSYSEYLKVIYLNALYNNTLSY